jgi:hypoxanthine-DNA glycosylase
MTTEHLKTSFEPVSNAEIAVLILGSLPSDASLALGEYYGHPRNRFWRVMSVLANQETPLTYAGKKELLLQAGIGLWDVAGRAIRKGSLDSAIEKEEPNDLETFIGKHPNLKVIAFNGTKAEALFNKYFSRKPGIQYLSLPSTSPANAGITFDNLCLKWQQIMKIIHPDRRG